VAERREHCGRISDARPILGGVEARLCTADGCETRLSAYNDDTRCAVHQHEMTDAEREAVGGLCEFESGCHKRAWKDKQFCRDHAGGVTREERIEAAVNLRRTAGLTNEEIAKRLDVAVASVGEYLSEGGAARVPTKAQAEAKAAAEARREERQERGDTTAPRRPPARDTVLEAIRAGARKRGAIMKATSLNENTVSDALAQLRAAGEIVMVGQKAGARYLLPGEDAESDPAPAPKPPDQKPEPEPQPATRTPAPKRTPTRKTMTVEAWLAAMPVEAVKQRVEALQREAEFLQQLERVHDALAPG
jgi:hypothetical protein